MSSASLFEHQPSECPQCGTSSVVPIVYGTPSEEMSIAAKLGQIVVRASSPEPIPAQWLCQDPGCNYEFC